MRPEHWLFTVPLRLRSLFRRKTEEYAAKGMAPEEARRRAGPGRAWQVQAQDTKELVLGDSAILRTVRHYDIAIGNRCARFAKK